MSRQPPSFDDLVETAKTHDHPGPRATKQAWNRLSDAIAGGVGPTVDPRPVPVAKAGAGLATKVAWVGGSALLLAVAWVAGSPPTPAPKEVTPAVPAVDPTTPTGAPPVQPAVETKAKAPDPIEPNPPSALPERDPTATVGRGSAPAQPPIASKRNAPIAPERSTDLAEEAQMLGRAWSELRAQRSAEAMLVVAAHRERFPNSVLSSERDACELVAQCQRRDPGAIARATAFLQEHPAGMPAKRVRAACVEKTEGNNKP